MQHRMRNGTIYKGQLGANPYTAKHAYHLIFRSVYILMTELC
jgi:hypothetical protein